MRKLFILSFSQIPNMPNQDKISLVTYCGLYCGLCAQRARIPQQAKQLEDTMHEEGYDFWYQYVPTFKETFPPFWQFLKQLAASDCTCKSGKGGPPDCKIRECAKKKKIATCPTCKEYPCELIENFSERYPLLIKDGKRMQKLGIEKWIEEQEQRAKRGFAYADIRYSQH
jgi:hypothetical protein